MSARRASGVRRGERTAVRSARRRGVHDRRRPLAGRRILVTRPRAQSQVLCDVLRRLGARPLAVPAIGIAPPAARGPLDRALRSLGRYDWVVLTSANGARACLARARALRLDLRTFSRPRWAAVGPATAAALRAAGMRVALIPSRYLTAAIAHELPVAPGQRILLLRTTAATPALADALGARGAVVDQVAAYRTRLAPRPLSPRLRRLIDARAIDTVLFTSASTVRGLVRMLGRRRGSLRTMTVACIGPVCAAAAEREGLRPQIVAGEHTTRGLINALLAAASKGAHHVESRAAH
ncbi:MAG: uroporphyrinogen-III synthase [bacterium]